MLEASRGLDRRDDLARNAQLGEGTERGLLVGPEVAYGLIEADTALLDEVLRLATREEVGTRLQAHETVVAAHDRVQSLGPAVASFENELQVFELPRRPLSLIVMPFSPCRLCRHLSSILFSSRFP